MNLHHTVATLFMMMHALRAIGSLSDWYFRWDLATEIASATSDTHEQEVLTRIAFYESMFSRNVSRCIDLGYEGNRSRGTFQVTGETPQERAASCGTLREQTRLALRYVRRSAERCPNAEGAWKLALYVSGDCNKGFAAAKLRWGSEEKENEHGNEEKGHEENILWRR